MNNKITKKRIKTFFIYDSIKLIAITLIICFVFLFIFNLVGTRLTPGQEFYLMLGNDLIVGNEANDLVNNCQEENVKNYGFSFDVLEAKVLNVVSAGQYPASYMISTYHQTNQDDVFICTDYVEGKDEENGPVTLYRNYINNLYATDILKYIEEAKSYVTANNFYNEEKDIWNNEEIKKYFVNRIKKDKRFKTSDQIEEGYLLEVERIHAIWKNADTLKKVLDNHPSLIYATNEEIIIDQNNKIIGTYALNLGALNGNGDNKISNVFKYAMKNDEGNIEYKTDGIVLMISKTTSQKDLNYESLAFINYLLNEYSTFIQELN